MNEQPRDGLESDEPDTGAGQPAEKAQAVSGEPGQADEATASQPEPATESGQAGAEPADIASEVTLTDREAAWNAQAEQSRKIDGRSVARIGGRVAAGVTATLACAALVWGAALLPESVSAGPAERSAVLHPAAPIQQRTCTGPALRVGTAEGQARSISALQEPQIASANKGGELLQSRLRLASAVQGSQGPASFQLKDSSSILAAAQTLSVENEAVRGFAASECAEPAIDQWLVGGSTRTGRQSIVTIGNPGRASASVDIEVFSANGPVSAVGSKGIAVPTASQVVIDLAALAPEVPDAVVRVRSTGSPVVAQLQQSTTRALERGGMDVVDPVSLAVSQVIPGIQLADPSGLETSEDYDDATAVLRVFALSSAKIQLTVTMPDGSRIESSGSVEGQKVTDFPLDRFPKGAATVTVTSDQPIVAGARAVVTSPAGLDFDWVAAGQPRSGTTSLSVPPGPSPSLNLVNTTDQQQQVTVNGESLKLAPGAAHSRPVAPGALEVSGMGIVISVSYLSPSQIGSFTASPQGPAAEGITVSH